MQNLIQIGMFVKKDMKLEGRNCYVNVYQPIPT